MKPKKNDTALNILIPRKLYTDAKEAADSKNISLAALVRMVLTQWLADNSSIEPIEDKDINEVFAELKGEIIPL